MAATRIPTEISALRVKRARLRGPASYNVPEMLLPMQLEHGAHSFARPEEDLLAAVLHEALKKLHLSLLKGDSAARRLTHDTLIWMRRRDESWLFDFHTICSYLGIRSAALYREVVRCCRTRNLRKLYMIVERADDLAHRARAPKHRYE